MIELIKETNCVYVSVCVCVCVFIQRETAYLCVCVLGCVKFSCIYRMFMNVCMCARVCVLVRASARLSIAY